ncbi:thermonuclease family protein [Allorhizobium sp. BGMRC 0089]|uniref:thermonuclease family protein n=1 Tax=Allorhizobium sonneratiae TaxID=2934936 RepID=UPI0020340BEB|nr:thermonuclease family protein [Allorhizobium sonneratiae]
MKRALTVAIGIFTAAHAANAAQAGYFDVPPTVTLESGDTWRLDGQRYRIYGIQSCLRGTAYTDKAGHKQDCGNASLAMLAAYIADGHPQCAPLIKEEKITYVVCYIRVANEILDLANVMITSGFAFTALNIEGLPYVPTYAVAEQTARQKKSGLWQFPDFPHPSVILSKLAFQAERVKK